MLATWLIFAFLASLALGRNTRKVCNVPAIGGGEDDGPTINHIFKQCASHSKIVLDKYYVVDTLLLTENLNDVEIELSGTGMSPFLPRGFSFPYVWHTSSIHS